MHLTRGPCTGRAPAVRQHGRVGLGQRLPAPRTLRALSRRPSATVEKNRQRETLLRPGAAVF